MRRAYPEGMSAMTGAEALIESLRANGVRHVFGIPSTHTLEIYRALGRAPDIEHITTSHEQGAAFMADGYARASGRPGVCLVTTGPGVTNAATAIAEAYSDSVPVLCVTAHIVSEDIGRGRGHSHELRSQESVLEGITDESHLILSPDRIAQAVHGAFRRFRTSRPRPVCLAIPVDVQEAPTSVPIPPAPNHIPCVPDREALRHASDLLASARTPAILAGGGAQAAAAQVKALSERLDAPVVTTLNGKGVIPTGHPLAASLAIYRSVARFLEECDVVLAVGTEISPADFWTGPLQLGGRLIHLDIDGEQIGRNHSVDTPVVGDAEATLGMMLESMAGPRLRAGASPSSACSRCGPGGSDGHGRSIPSVGQGPTRRSARRVVLGAGCCDGGRVRSLSLLRPSRTEDVDEPVRSGNTRIRTACRDRRQDRQTRAGGGGAGGGRRLHVHDVGVDGWLRNTGWLCRWSSGNDRAFGEIHRLMRERGFEPLATDLNVPDLATLAAAYGAGWVRVDEPAGLAAAVQDALAAGGPTLVEVPAWS